MACRSGTGCSRHVLRANSDSPRTDLQTSRDGLRYLASLSGRRSNLASSSMEQRLAVIWQHDPWVSSPAFSLARRDESSQVGIAGGRVAQATETLQAGHSRSASRRGAACTSPAILARMRTRLPECCTQSQSASEKRSGTRALNTLPRMRADRATPVMRRDVV